MSFSWLIPRSWGRGRVGAADSCNHIYWALNVPYIKTVNPHQYLVNLFTNTLEKKSLCFFKFLTRFSVCVFKSKQPKCFTRVDPMKPWWCQVCAMTIFTFFNLVDEMFFLVIISTRFSCFYSVFANGM